MAAVGAVLACEGGYQVHLPGLGLELGPIEDAGSAERALDVLRLRLAVESGSDVRGVEVSTCHQPTSLLHSPGPCVGPNCIAPNATQPCSQLWAGQPQVVVGTLNLP